METSTSSAAFPPPAGDFNGDGIGDVIVKNGSRGPRLRSVLDFAVAIEAISGRNGARLWSASVPSMDMPYIDETSDWLEPRVIEPNGLPDLIVRRDAEGCRAPGAALGGDGRTRWETSVSNEARSMLHAMRLRFFDDLDGDGALTSFWWFRVSAEGQTEFTMMAVSLRDGKQLWSQPLRFLDRVMMLGDLRVGDLDGDKLPEVVAFEGSGEDGKNELGGRRFDGRDGKVRWAWTSGFVPSETPAGQWSCWRTSMGTKSGKCA